MSQCCRQLQYQKMCYMQFMTILWNTSSCVQMRCTLQLENEIIRGELCVFLLAAYAVALHWKRGLPMLLLSENLHITQHRTEISKQSIENVTYTVLLPLIAVMKSKTWLSLTATDKWPLQSLTLLWWLITAWSLATMASIWTGLKTAMTYSTVQCLQTDYLFVIS